jgi:hypothetical protein
MLKFFFLLELRGIFLLGLIHQLLILITAWKTFLDIFKYLKYYSFLTAYQRHYLGTHEFIDPEHPVLSLG